MKNTYCGLGKLYLTLLSSSMLFSVQCGKTLAEDGYNLLSLQLMYHTEVGTPFLTFWIFLRLLELSLLKSPFSLDPFSFLIYFFFQNQCFPNTCDETTLYLDPRGYHIPEYWGMCPDLESLNKVVGLKWTKKHSVSFLFQCLFSLKITVCFGKVWFSLFLQFQCMDHGEKPTIRSIL